MAREFQDSDVDRRGKLPHIYADRDDLFYEPLWFHERGLQQTASGYGRKLTTPLKISFNGKLYRIYCTCFSNAGSNWFIVKGEKIYVG
jgi:hypothetical protein